MKNRRLHRLFALSMAFLMFGVSVGFSADFHYCQGEFKNFALYKHAKSCHELAAMKASCHTDAKSSCHSAKITCDSEEENGCCSNDTKLVQFDLDYGFGSFSIAQEANIDFKYLLGTEVIESYAHKYHTKNKFFKYKPPLIVTEKTILFQSFLC